VGAVAVCGSKHDHHDDAQHPPPTCHPTATHSPYALFTYRRCKKNCRFRAAAMKRQGLAGTVRHAKSTFLVTGKISRCGRSAHVERPRTAAPITIPALQ
jgi:hypothetical protein